MNRLAEPALRSALARVPELAVEALRLVRLAGQNDGRPPDEAVPLGFVGPVLILGHPDAAPRVGDGPWCLHRIDAESHRRLAESMTARATRRRADEGWEDRGGWRGGAPDDVRARLRRVPWCRSAGAAPDAALEGEREILLQYATGIPLIDPAAIEVDPAVASLVPPEFVRRYGGVPLAFDGRTVVMASRHVPTDPDGRRLAAAWRASVAAPAATAELRWCLCCPGSLEALLGRQAAPAAVAEPGPARSTRADEARLRVSSGDVQRLENGASGLDDESLVRWAVASAVRSGASDLHLQLRAGLGEWRLRVDGRLERLLAFDGARYAACVNVVKSLADLDSAGHRLQDARLPASVDGRLFDVRVSAMPQAGAAAEALALRFLEADAVPARLAALGVSDRVLGWIEDAVREPQGLILVTGPTGSGKTTTLAAIAHALNAPDVKLLTVEDPVEYRIDGAVQVPVGRGITFGSALRAFLRHDPDVILVGEIRDADTASAAIAAAKTGHLVLSSLHTNSASRAVGRLRDFGIGAWDLADGLVAVVAQRLVRQLCPVCSEMREVTETEAAAFQRLRMNPPPLLFQPVGCRHCRGGWSGRFPVAEVIRVTPEVRRLLETNAQPEALDAAARGAGAPSLALDGLRAVARGRTTCAELEAHLGSDPC